MYCDFLDRMNFTKCKSIEKYVCYILCTVVALSFSIWVFVSLDRTPATFDDYEELHNRLLSIQENPDELINNEGTITIYDDEIVYKIENQECEMTGRYTRDFKLKEYSQKDKASTLFLSIICGFVTFFIVGLILFFVVYIITFIGESIVIGIILLIKKIWR